MLGEAIPASVPHEHSPAAPRFSAALTSVVTNTPWRFSPVKLPTGKRVYIVALWPIYPAEAAWADDNDGHDLLKLLKKHRISPIIDPHRPSVVPARD